MPVKKKTKVVLDTNILISASFWKGNPYKVLRKCIDMEIEIFCSQEILDEYARVLKIDFEMYENEILFRINFFLGAMILAYPKEEISEIKEDESDNRILELAVESGSKIIVSGDKHLLSVKEFRGIKILSAKEFLDLFSI